MTADIKGETFIATRDGKRLGAQLVKVRDTMSQGGWWTLNLLSEQTGAPPASVSARIRDLRRLGWTVDREYVERGLWRYRATKPDPSGQLSLL
jgi:hypothetical protein